MLGAPCHAHLGNPFRIGTAVVVINVLVIPEPALGIAKDTVALHSDKIAHGLTDLGWSTAVVAVNGVRLALGCEARGGY